MKKNLPNICPGCSTTLQVKCLRCSQCQTEVIGIFNLPPLAILSQEDQDFIISFIRCSGSLKTMAQQLSLSYPTVRNLLDGIIEKIESNH
jgi:hypothetical protein